MRIGIEDPTDKNYYRSDYEDERDAEERAIDDWIQITSSRNSNWWFSALHNITAMVGAGVLAFPYSMSKLGWGAGVTALVMSWVVTLYTLWQMIEMHEMVPGKRFDRYHELGQYAFGEKLGLWIVLPQQLIVEAGVDIVFMVAGAKSIEKFHELVSSSGQKTESKYYIMMFASVNFALSQLPDIHSISGVSLASAIMSMGYCTIIWATSLGNGKRPDAQYDYKAKNTADAVLDFFGALGTVAFAYAGHNVVLEIQSSMSSTPQRPSKVPMWRGVLVAYIIVGLCYFPVAIVGYWAFGNTASEDIVDKLESPTWLMAMANLLVVFHLVGTYQIYAMPVYNIIEIMLVKKLRFKPSWYLRFVARNAYVGVTMIVAMTIPFFGGLLGFFGGFVFAPTTYFLPCIMWLAIFKPRRFSLSWFTNWICIILGVALMIVASIGGLGTIIDTAKDWKFFRLNQNQTIV